ncbi:MAG: glycosyltransferase family 4 protein [Phycisphaerae bacterium]
MRIVHVITRLIVGGAQENTILSCEGLHARGHAVHLFAGPTAGPEGSLVSRAASGGYGHETIPDLVREVSPRRDLQALRVLRRRFEALRPDVVHTHSSKAGVLGRIAAAEAEVPCIVHTIHGMSFNRTQPWLVREAFRLAERYCADRCHALVTVADAMARQALAAGIGRPAQYETIRSGMELDSFDPARHDASEMRRRWGVGAEDVVVGTVARLFRNKGYEQLIEIIALAVRAEPNLRFLWVGDGADRARYEAALTRRGLRDRVILCGLVPPAEMPRILSAIDILAHTSQWEGLPRAVVQALLMEKPAVSFAIDGAPEVVWPGQTGELVELGDLGGFAKAVVDLARDPARRAAYGRCGRSRCLREFDHTRMVDRLDSLYRRLRSSL